MFSTKGRQHETVKISFLFRLIIVMVMAGFLPIKVK